MSERLFGETVGVSECRVVFRFMLPTAETATLAAVTAHGLVLRYDAEPDGDVPGGGLLVPWSQIAYLTFA